MPDVQAGEWLVTQWHFPEGFAAIAGRRHQARDGGAVDLLGVIEALPPKLAAKLGSEEEFAKTITGKVKALQSTLRPWSARPRYFASRGGFAGIVQR